MLYSLLPAGVNQICSPFLGGGSFELMCAHNGIEVLAYDAFKPLVNFWKMTLDNARAVAKLARRYYPMSRNQFYALQKQYDTLTDSQSMAAAFYALNRASFSGTTLSGGMSPGHPRFNANALDRLGSMTAQGRNRRGGNRKARDTAAISLMDLAAALRYNGLFNNDRMRLRQTNAPA